MLDKRYFTAPLNKCWKTRASANGAQAAKFLCWHDRTNRDYPESPQAITNLIGSAPSSGVTQEVL
jgi:hypothetical protein